MTVSGSKERGGIPWRMIGWGGAVCLLLTPLVAMQFTREVDWSPMDFAIMGVLFAITGGGIELAVRRSTGWAYRAGAALAVITAFLLVWVNLAVGYLGDEGNPANLAFLVLILATVAAAIGVRGKAATMAKVMLATAAAQVGIGVVALAMGYASPGGEGAYEVTLGSTLFGGLWLVSSLLFRKAARQGV